MAVYGNIENIDAIVLANVEAGARHIDGFSPVVETEQTATGEHIKITDKNAVHEFDIRNGSAMAARVEDETAVFTNDGAQYQSVEISDEGEHFETDTVEGALNELYETATNIASDVADLQDALETEQAAIRTVALGGTGADNAEDAIENLGIADYVVEQTDFYTKWKSGKCECWGRAVLTSGTQDRIVSISLPVGMSGNYYVNLSPYLNGSIIEKLWCGNRAGNNTKESGKFDISANINTNNYDIGVDWRVVGKWK